MTRKVSSLRNPFWMMGYNWQASLTAASKVRAPRAACLTIKCILKTVKSSKVVPQWAKISEKSSYPTYEKKSKVNFWREKSKIDIRCSLRSLCCQMRHFYWFLNTVLRTLCLSNNPDFYQIFNWIPDWNFLPSVMWAMSRDMMMPTLLGPRRIFRKERNALELWKKKKYVL